MPSGVERKEKVVRRTLADGTVKEYRYRRTKVPKEAAAPIAAGSVRAMINDWQMSPEWNDLREKTKANYSIYLRELKPLWEVPAASIRRRHVIAIRNSIASVRGNGAATGFIRVTGALWAWAMDNDYAETSPAHRIKPLRRGTLPTWSEEVLGQALVRLDEPYRRVVILAVYTGQRRGDLIQMPWSAYDGSTIRLRQQKERGPEEGKRELIIPCHRVLKRELDSWRAEGRQSTTILLSPRGLPWTPEHLSRELGRAVKELGFGRFTLHGLRKLAAVRLAQAGCSVHEIAAIGGWKSLSMVQKYTEEVSRRGLAEAAIVRLENARARPKR